MIRCVKSAKEPSSLAKGPPATKADCDGYDTDPAAYRSGARTFTIAKKIYGTETVKRALKADQHSKCAFCEAIFDANVAGDVEHYRPKGAVSGTPNGKIRPGYYWLGYVWSNLSYACPDCNQYKKRDQFPLVDEAERALSHNDDIAAEDPLLLDPYGAEDPRDHIRFRGEAPHGASLKGTATIQILGLARTALSRDRLNHLYRLGLLRDALAALSAQPPDDRRLDLIARIRTSLEAAVRPEAEFSAAAVDYLAALDAGIDPLPKRPAG